MRFDAAALEGFLEREEVPLDEVEAVLEKDEPRLEVEVPLEEVEALFEEAEADLEEPAAREVEDDLVREEVDVLVRVDDRTADALVDGPASSSASAFLLRDLLLLFPLAEALLDLPLAADLRGARSTVDQYTAELCDRTRRTRGTCSRLFVSEIRWRSLWRVRWTAAHDTASWRERGPHAHEDLEKHRAAVIAKLGDEVSTRKIQFSAHICGCQAAYAPSSVPNPRLLPLHTLRAHLLQALSLICLTDGSKVGRLVRRRAHISRGRHRRAK